MKIVLTSVMVDDQKKALFDAGIPSTSFGIDDVRKEFERLQARGVVFRMEPTQK